MAIKSVRGYILAVKKDGAEQSGQVPGTKATLAYDVRWTDGIVGVMTNIKPHGRPNGPDLDLEILSAGIGWDAWGTVTPLGLTWHCMEQEITVECGSDGEPPIPLPPGVEP